MEPTSLSKPPMRILLLILNAGHVLESWRNPRSARYGTWSILYEFLRVTTHSRVLKSPWTASQAWQFVNAIITAPALGVLVETDRHAAVAQEVLNDVPQLQGNLLHDTHTAVLMKEHGIRQIYTRDMDFHRFPYLEVIDPLKS
jgi:predicted nucleic acid-binding protein